MVEEGHGVYVCVCGGGVCESFVFCVCSAGQLITVAFFCLFFDGGSELASNSMQTGG